MSTSPTPIYRAPDATWQIDSCQPQLAAIAAGKIAFHALSHGTYPGERLKTGELPGISSIGHWTAAKAQDWGLEAHRNEGVEICWLESGALDFEVDGKRHDLNPDALTLTRPWQMHKLGAPHLGANRLHWLILDVGVRRPNQPWRWPAWVVMSPADRDELALRLRESDRPVLRATPEIRAIFRRLAQAVEAHPKANQVSPLAISINDLLWRLLESMRGAAQARQGDARAPEAALRERTVRLFLDDLSRHPEHFEQPWTVKTMAAECGMGVTAFTALARACVGIPPMEWLAVRRLEHGAQLLRRDPARAVTDIALACGFSSSQYFATCFGRKFGCTPGAWREKAK